jgi:hypothetical protein
MRKLLEGLGAREVFDSPGVVCMDIPLDPELMPDTPVARSVREAASSVSPGGAPVNREWREWPADLPNIPILRLR